MASSLVFGVIEYENLIGGLDHIGGIAVTVGKGGAAHRVKAVIPFGDARIKRGLRVA